MLGYALANSTPGNNSPQLEHHKAASRDPNSSSTVWMMCRLENIYFASAFMYADALTLVASGADIHACAAAMPPALPRITTWAAEHSLKINVAKSEAALFHISSHTHGLTRKWSISFLAMGTHVFSPAQCACWTPRSIYFLILLRTLPPLQSRPCKAVTNCDRSHRLVRSITIRNPFRLDTSMSCHCIMAMQLSHALPPPASIIWKHCTATVVKHTLALVHQRKMHLSNWKPIFSRSGRYSGSATTFNTNAMHVSMITGI
ncbi:hypothetical protein TCDM_08740 [Trypanosoma cruzi Dm28c]|uniref:Uncharacterized protein n=1 Tax=Trypanosoma cruzi Dm28c TaxID=1416333 RepID=V5ARM2_TRYCR|nr:hypothetical protein TCDM_08740 [Trypanosoma cruzi Dm28c]